MTQLRQTQIAHRIAVALLGLAALSPVIGAPVTVTSSNLVTSAYDGGPSDVDADSSTAFGTRSLSSTAGGTSATTLVDWRDTGTGALFDFDFDHRRSGNVAAFAQSYDSVMVFNANENTTYSLAGLYAAQGSPNRTYFNVYLFDRTRGQTLFQDYSQSYYTANESFTLGMAGDGDLDYNYTVGSLTGNLIAGNTYEFYFAAFIQTYPNRDTGATAYGCVSLAIGSAAVDGECGVAAEAGGHVPEPGTLALAGLALAGLGGLRRRAGR